MKKIILIIFLIGTFGVLTLSMGGCGGAAPDTSDTGNNNDGGGGGDGTGSSSGASWSASGEALTIDDIVNGSSSGSSLTKTVSTSSSASFYFGRFILDDGADLRCGSIKFKLNKENSNSAYFSDVSLENMSTAINGTSNTPTVTNSTDLDVDPSYSASSNHVEIANATSRFVAFDLDFGNNDHFEDVTDAGVIFSSDFSTMAGGDDANFFFIAQKVDSQPDVVNSDLVDDWSALRFSVSFFTGAITIESTVDVSIAASNSNNLPFTGTDAEFGNFDGLLGLTDDSAACFAYTFGTLIDGGFVLSADKTLAVGYDLTARTYFAMEKAN